MGGVTKQPIFDLDVVKETVCELEDSIGREFDENELDRYKDFLRDRIECMESLNNEYGSDKFKPFPTTEVVKQLNVLNYYDIDELKKFIGEEHKEEEFDSVNNPYHYASGKYECIEVMRDTFGDETLKSFCLLNAFKYLFRSNKKNGAEDLKKAQWYLNYIIENLI